MEDIQKAMAAIRAHTDSVTQAKAEAIRGEAGPRGPVGQTGPAGEPGKNGRDGKDGRDGRDGKDAVVDLTIGSVTSGPEAAAHLRRTEDGSYVLSLVLPKGDRGITGATGAQGERGLPGEKSDIPGPRGAAGRDGVNGAEGARGPQGIQGVPGLQISEIQQAVIETLQSAGVHDSLVEKLVRTKLLLRQSATRCSARHIAELESIIQKAEDIFDGINEEQS